MCLESLIKNENGISQLLLSPTTLVNMAMSNSIWKEILEFHQVLVNDEVSENLDTYFREGIKRFGEHWRHLENTNVLYAAAKLLRPKNYLEIGVRRGHSSSCVVKGFKRVNITGFDLWVENYADIENPGPEYVKTHLKKCGHIGNVELISGDSHETIPRFFREHPMVKFDLIFVDGDHTENGAYDDLCNVIPSLSDGGIIVFDDIIHPSHLYLNKVWDRVMERFPYLVSYKYMETGNGVAFAIRRPATVVAEGLSDRYKSYFYLMNEWFRKIELGKSIVKYLNIKGIKNIAIYGAGNLGQRLFHQLKESQINVKCFIDSRNDSSLSEMIPIINLNNLSTLDIDTIIVTPIYDFKNIKNKIERLYNNIQILSLEDVIYNL